jgi:protein involved in polysaccharide export with SLBB domain
MNSYLTLLLVLVLGGFPPLHANTPEENTEIYGAKDSSTIEVRIYGGGVRNPGIYNLKSPATLKDIIDRAIWLRSSNGKFQVTRLNGGAKITIEVDRDDLSFGLLDGDLIYAEAIRIEKKTEPNQRLQTTRFTVPMNAISTGSACLTQNVRHK